MAAPPRLLSRRANGEPVEGPALSETPKAHKVKGPTQGEKVVVRRLPPGMTEDEFVTILGEEWKIGNAKVDWFSYVAGKISTHPSKPSVPSRAYLHVVKRDLLTALLERVQSCKWEDAKESYNDPALISPPTVEFSIYKKVPAGNKRLDNRQGTIDQDPEFMAFLESLANPDAAKESTDAEQQSEESAKIEKATTTPLIEFLKEKRATKAKELAAAKSAKHGRQESQGGKGKAASAAPEETKKRTRDGRADKVAEKAPERPKESIRILSKRGAAATEAAAEAAKAAKAVAAQVKQGAQSSTPAASSEGGSGRNRKSGIAAAALILQRDLGLNKNTAHRKARQEASKEAKETKETKESRASSGKETVARENNTAVPATQQSRSAEVSPPTANSKGQHQQQQNASASAAASGSGSGSGRSRNRRRGGGGGGEDGGKGKAESSKAEKAPEKATPAPATTKPAVILLKKKDPPPPPPPTQPQSQRTSTPVTPSSAGPSSAPPGQKAATQKQGGGGGGGGGGSKKNNAAPAPSSGATRAFIKHANHSQGVTEALLREALQAFGTVTLVDIDRKKGFAYVDFADPESLVKAMAASPVTVAQATVQVLERKDTSKKGGGGGGGGGGSGGGGGGSSQNQSQGQGKNAANSSSSQAAAPAPPPGPSASTSTPATTPVGEKPAGEQQSQGGSKRTRQHRGKRTREKDGKEGGGKDKGGGGGSGSGVPPAAPANSS